MTGWDFLNTMAQAFPPIALVLLLIIAIVALIIFIIGFSKYGIDFVKHGFQQTALDASLEHRFDAFERRFDELGVRIEGLGTELDTIKVNHFGHLKNYLGVLNGILLDKNIISNQEKARLDNELRGM